MDASLISYRSTCQQIAEIARDKGSNLVALRYCDSILTYEQLDRRATRFAGHLHRLGVGPGATVAICMHRSFEWITAALAIMHVGAAYVPLDPSWPDARLRFALEDCGAVALVAPAALTERLGTAAQRVDPFLEAEIIESTPPFEAENISPDSLAYLIYTSGSTGVPKGVEITHANLYNLVEWHVETFAVTSGDRASHLAGLGFDAAGWEIWPHLAAGATLCLPDEDAVRFSPALIQQWMLEEEITLTFVPTIHAVPLMDLKWPASSRLRVLLTGGDALPHGPAHDLPFIVVNNYGPSECTVVATSATIPAHSTATPPIGRPITGARIYLLDEQGEQVGDGQVGEIYIGGRGVGKGYRNLPELTSQCFLPDPFAKTPDARMYRSGDRGLRLPDGQIAFRGRVDRQAKIRGYRIELDEVGSVLGRHPGIAFAVAVAERSEAKEPELVAYVLPAQSTAVPGRRELQAFLGESLPAYMVPNAFVTLDALPVSANGKLDLTLLPKRDATLPKPNFIGFVLTTTEQKLLALVQEVLRSEAITPQDNFFLAGGHSLLGMQLVMRVSKTFGVALTLRQLFEAPTVQALAYVLETRLTEERLTAIWRNLLGAEAVTLDQDFARQGGTASSLHALQRRIVEEFGRRFTIQNLIENPTVRQQAQLLCRDLRPTFALPAGVVALQPEGHGSSFFWVHYPCENLARAMGEDRPFLFVTLTDADLRGLGEAPSLEDIAGCLAGKISRTQPEGPYVLGGFCVGGLLAFEVAQQLQAAGHDVSLTVMLDTPSPVYYQNPGLFAPRLTEPQYVLRRVARLGLRGSLKSARNRVGKRLGKSFISVRRGSVPQPQPELDPVQKLIESAASRYQPRPLNAEVALLLSTGYAPHVNFLHSWRALVSGNLASETIQGEHMQLTSAPVVNHVANAINKHLARATAPLASLSGPVPEQPRSVASSLTV